MIEDIYYEYDCIRFTLGQEDCEPLKVIIEGQIKNRLFDEHQLIDYTIKLGDESYPKTGDIAIMPYRHEGTIYKDGKLGFRPVDGIQEKLQTYNGGLFFKVQYNYFDLTEETLHNAYIASVWPIENYGEIAIALMDGKDYDFDLSVKGMQVIVSESTYDEAVNLLKNLNWPIADALKEEDYFASVKKDTQKPVVKSMSIEIRNQNLYIKKSALKYLTLDGQAYAFDKDLYESLVSSHVVLNYPLLISGLKEVYNLETNMKVLESEAVQAALHTVWGEAVASEGYAYYGELEFTPDNLRYIDNALLDDGKIFFSIHAFMAELVDSMVGVFDIQGGSFEFIDKPFYGQVSSMHATEDGKYLVYMYYTVGDRVSRFIDIISTEDMAYLRRFKASDIEDQMDAVDEHISVRIEHIRQEEDILIVSLAYKDDDEIISRSELRFDIQASSSDE